MEEERGPSKAGKIAGFGCLRLCAAPSTRTAEKEHSCDSSDQPPGTHRLGLSQAPATHIYSKGLTQPEALVAATRALRGAEPASLSQPGAESVPGRREQAPQEKK